MSAASVTVVAAWVGATTAPVLLLPSSRFGHFRHIFPAPRFSVSLRAPNNSLTNPAIVLTTVRARALHSHRRAAKSA